MRIATLIVMICLAGSVLGSPSIEVQLSEQDIREISALIEAETREPILLISHAAYERKRAPNSVPREIIETRIEDGKVVTRPLTVYERTNRVGVQTGDRQNLKGGSYLLEHDGKTWRIIRKSFWIH